MANITRTTLRALEAEHGRRHPGRRLVAASIARGLGGDELHLRWEPPWARAVRVILVVAIVVSGAWAIAGLAGISAEHITWADVLTG